MTSFSNRQRQVMEGIVKGKTNKKIAIEMGVSEKTVKAHVTSLFKKTGNKSRTEFVIDILTAQLAEKEAEISRLKAVTFEVDPLHDSNQAGLTS